MQLDEAFRRLNIVQDFIPVGSSNRPGTRLTPTSITIHNTDNTNRGANAAAHARYVKSQDARDRQVSWHYTVDDNFVFQSLPTNEVGWHAGPGNRSSIGIEICMHEGMNVPAAYDRAALLTAVMAHQLGVSVQNGVVQHHSWTGKHCPRVLRDKPNGWTSFLQSVRTYYGALQNVFATEIALEGLALENCCEIVSAAKVRKASKRSKKRARAAKKPAARRAGPKKAQHKTKRRPRKRRAA